VRKCAAKVAAAMKCMYVRARSAIEPIVVDRGLNIALMETWIVQSMSGDMNMDQKRVIGIHSALIASLDLCSKHHRV